MRARFVENEVEMSPHNPRLPRGQTVLISGEAVRALRIEKNWDVRHLAAESRVSEKTIEIIEKGEKSVFPSTLERIAAALEVGYATLLPDPMPVASPTTQEKRSVNVVIKHEGSK